MVKKSLTVILILVLFSAALFACSDRSDAGNAGTAGESIDAETKTQALNGLTFPLTDEKTTITVLLPYESPLITDPNEIRAVQIMEERTNVHVNWITYNTSEMMTRWPQILASGDYPDIMFPSGTNLWPGGYLQGILDGILVDIDKYRDCFTNYFSLLNMSPFVRQQAASEDGIVHIAKVIRGTDTEIAPADPIIGPAIRLDILIDLGLSIPETVDELHEALLLAKEAGMIAPMTLEQNGGSMFSLAFEVKTGSITNNIQYDPDTRTVSYSGLNDGFYDYLDTMSAWYQEGLIDKNFTSPPALWSSDYSSFENNETLFYPNWYYRLMGETLQNTGYITNEKCFLQAVPGFTLNEDESPVSLAENCYTAQEIYIREGTGKTELLCKWVDYLYTREEIDLRYYGVENESYTIDENGEYCFTDQILNNPNGLSFDEALGYYAFGTDIGFQNDGADLRKALAKSPSGRNYMKESQKIWASPAKSLALPTGITLNAEDQEICDTCQNTLNTLMSEFMVKSILGQNTMSKEDFKKLLLKNGAGTIVDIYQRSVDRFNER